MADNKKVKKSQKIVEKILNDDMVVQKIDEVYLPSLPDAFEYLSCLNLSVLNKFTISS